MANNVVKGVAAMKPEDLLTKVKDNLILTHDEDDKLLLGLIAAALDYAESYQKRKYRTRLPAATEQAVIMLATHFYESRDGSTAGFFADHNIGGSASLGNREPAPSLGKEVAGMSYRRRFKKKCSA